MCSLNQPIITLVSFVTLLSQICLFFQYLVIFFLKSNSVCYHTRDKQMGRQQGLNLTSISRAAITY